MGIDGVVPEEYLSVYLINVTSLKTGGKLEEIIARDAMMKRWKPQWTAVIVTDREEGQLELNKYVFCTDMSEFPLSERLAKLAYYSLRTHPILDSDGRPYSTPLIDLNFAYRTCFEVTHSLLLRGVNWEEPRISRVAKPAAEKTSSPKRFRFFHR